MLSWQVLTDFGVILPDRPGELGRFGARLRAADINLIGLWGSGSGHDGAHFQCIPDNPDQFRNFAQSIDLRVQEGSTFLLSGADHPGVLVEILERIAARSINLRRIHSVSIDGRFGCFVWADAADWRTLTDLLG
ncbi:MAG: hypothetical protein KF817_09665 [Phycisphaeraceae bacterium]|nr:hypothetical protein [Phycisphaeraceae bacterium]